MIYVALTGIARHVIRELLAARVRTIEIRSPNNFVALLNVKSGNKIFLTEASAPDILLGTSGLIASVMGIQTITHRVIQSSEDYNEERERLRLPECSSSLLALGGSEELPPSRWESLWS